MGARVGIAADAVLGAEEGDELDLRDGVEDVDGAAQTSGDAGGVCYQANAFADERLEAVGDQHVDAGADDRFDAGLRGPGESGERDRRDDQRAAERVHGSYPLLAEVYFSRM